MNDFEPYLCRPHREQFGCTTELPLDQRHDAYFCAEHNVWLSEACNELNCGFCRDRPKTPLQVHAGMYGLVQDFWGLNVDDFPYQSDWGTVPIVMVGEEAPDELREQFSGQDNKEVTLRFGSRTIVGLELASESFNTCVIRVSDVPVVAAYFHNLEWVNR